MIADIIISSIRTIHLKGEVEASPSLPKKVVPMKS